MIYVSTIQQQQNYRSSVWHKITNILCTDMQTARQMDEWMDRLNEVYPKTLFCGGLNITYVD